MKKRTKRGREEIYQFFEEKGKNRNGSLPRFPNSLSTLACLIDARRHAQVERGAFHPP